MADTTTTNLLLTKPEVGASTDTWGTKINSDLDSIDALFDAGPLLKVTKGGTGVGTKTGTGNVVLSTSPTLVTPALGTPSALVGTNITGTAANFNINGTVGATTPATGAFTTLSATGTGVIATLTGTGVTNYLKMTNTGQTSANGFQVQTVNEDVYVVNYSTAGNIFFSTNGSSNEDMTINAAGGVKHINTISVGNATPSTSGAGITFPATQSASSDANTLDDYEEGTAAVTFSTETSGTITVNTTQDSVAYTKVGRQVTITGQVQISSVSSPVGTFVHVNSLPFVCADLSELSGRVGGAVTFYDDSASTYTARGVLMLEGGSQMRLYQDASTVAANDGFIFSFSYFTT
jgi:hypothetical protein